MKQAISTICLDPRLIDNADEELQQEILDLIKVCGFTMMVETDPPLQSEFFTRASRTQLVNLWVKALKSQEIIVRYDPKVADFVSTEMENDGYFRKFCPDFFVTTQPLLRVLVGQNKDLYVFYPDSKSLAYRDSKPVSTLAAGKKVFKAPSLPLIGRALGEKIKVGKSKAEKNEIIELCRYLGSTNSILKIHDKLLLLKIAQRLDSDRRAHPERVDGFDLIDAMCRGTKVKTIEIYSKQVQEGRVLSITDDSQQKERQFAAESIDSDRLQQVCVELTKLVNQRGKSIKFFILKADVEFDYQQGNPDDCAFILGSHVLVDWPHFSVAYTKTGRTRIQTYSSSFKKTWISTEDEDFLTDEGNLVRFQ